MKAEKVAPPAELNEAIKDLLSDEAIQIVTDKGVHCTIWFRKEIP